MIKVLNLYCGIGGNRKLWENVEVTAIENNAEIAKIYSDFFPKDNVIIADAHSFLEEHFSEYDFIWSSPPCQSHASFRQNINVRFRGSKAKYPDFKLYEEIVFLRANAKCKWVVENVSPYYEPLIKPTIKLQRHLFWSNFIIEKKEFRCDYLRNNWTIGGLSKHHAIDLSCYKLKNKRQILRNCMFSPIGDYIFKEAFNESLIK